jgi:hypothetical protein
VTPSGQLLVDLQLSYFTCPSCEQQPKTAFRATDGV